VIVAMPRLSDSMEEGTVVRWLKAEGETVSAGEAIVEIETDKATMEYEAEAAGVLAILAAEGATAAVGEPIAEIRPSGSAGRARVRATPLARRIAAELGVELSEIRGTGRRGHIIKADVEAAATGNGHRSESAREQGIPAAEKIVDNFARNPLTATQRRIAARMSDSRATVPDFALEVEIDMEACLALRAQLAEHVDPVPSINDMIVKACALALAQHPRVNGSYRDDAFELHDHVSVGVAVAAPDALIVPVVHDANRLPLAEIAKATKTLAAKVRSGEITPAELAGATFTVSNLGMYGITRFDAVINPPQAAILAVGAVEARAVVRNEQIQIARTMAATLASDHRIVYGADAAAFLRDVRARLEAPIGLLI
jgi:pyruvate dehydrogenase E2 component (dihydrolipoamide acetyltransferase)